MARKSRKPPPETFTTYVLEIADWEPCYHLSLNEGAMQEGLYWEHPSARITATCIFPPKLEGKPVRIELFGQRDLLHPPSLENDPDWKPRTIGALTTRPGGLDFYAAVPYDAIFGIVGMLATGRWSYLLLHGLTMRRGKSLCRSFYFERTINLHDY